MDKLKRSPRGRELKTVLRKGRENYLCLLNFEDAAKRHALASGQRAVAPAMVVIVRPRAFLIGRILQASRESGIPRFGDESGAAMAFPRLRQECVLTGSDWRLQSLLLNG